MKYKITSDCGDTLAQFDVPEGGSFTFAVEREDRPDLTLVGVDLHGNGSVAVGHWPKGEDWEQVLTTSGVLNQYGTSGEKS